MPVSIGTEQPNAGDLATIDTRLDALETDTAALQTGKQDADADLTTWASLSPSGNFQTLVPETFAQMRTSLGLGIGVNVQAYSPNLTSWAAVTRATGFDTFAATPTSANLAALLTDESGAGALLFAGGALGTPASGTLTNCTGLPTAGLVNSAVTYAKIQNVSATSTFLGRKSAGAGVPEELSATDAMTILGASAAQVRAQTATNVALTPASLASRPAFAVDKSSSAQGSIVSGVPTKVTFANASVLNNGTCFDTTNSRFVAPGPGVMRVSARLLVTTVQNGGMYAIVYKNGSLLFYGPVNDTVFAGGNDSVHVNALVPVAANDTIELYFLGASAGAITISGSISETYFHGDMV